MNKRWLPLLLLLMTAPLPLHAQGQQITAGPFPVSGLLYVCPVPSGGTPCPSPVSIFSNVTLTTGLSNPIVVFAQQVYTFYAASGTYTLEMPAAGYQAAVGGSTGGSSGGGLDQTINPMQAPYNAKGDVKGLPNCSWTSASNTVTCSDGPFTSADVGKIMFGTRSTAQVNVNALTDHLDIVQGTICATGFVSATQVNVCAADGVTASNATNTCPDGTHPNCNFYWGTADDTTAIIAAQNAAWNTVGRCKALQLPAAWFFMTLSATATNNLANGPVGNACATASGTAAFSDLTSVGPEIYGQGQQVSKIVLLPNSVFTGCTNGTAGGSCMGTAPNLQAHDFGIDGGQNPVGGTHAIILWESTGANGGGNCDGGATVWNMSFSGFALTSTNSVGFQAGIQECNDPYFANNNISMFGATTCQTNSGSGANTLTLYSVLCFGGNPTVFNVAASAAYQLNTYGSGFYSSLATGGAVVTVNAPVDWNSNGDNFLNANVTSTQFSLIRCNSAATLHFVNDRVLMPTTTNATSVAFFNNASGCSMHFRNTRATATGTNNELFLTVSGSNIINEGGNTFTNGTVANSFSGNTWAMASESGTVTCATSAATITFKGTYLVNPIVVIQDQTTAGAVTQTSISTTNKVVGCPGASDVLLYTVTPNPI